MQAPQATEGEKIHSDAERKHELEKETKLWSGLRLAILESVTRRESLWNIRGLYLDQN